MRFVSVVFSPTGGTRRAADCLLEGLDGPAAVVDLADPQADPAAFAFGPEDVAVLALPVYGGRIPAAAARRAAALRGNGARCVLVCVYGNRAFDNALAEMNALAQRAGFAVAAAVAAVAEHSLVRQVGAGRPDAADAARLREFAGQIRAALDAGVPAEPLAVPGKVPETPAGPGKLVPKASDACDGCGLCARQCPAGAIDPAAPQKTDPAVCISCMRCVEQCPRQARAVNGAMLGAVQLMLKKLCAARREPELFLPDGSFHP